ncbi:MAG: FadR/GntR family transcriptional regulator [Spirochaetota bacterium]
MFMGKTSEKNSYGDLKVTRTRSLYEQIADKIQHMIVTKELEPGQKLAPERELTTMLGVSRPTMREAMKVLRDRGLLEYRPGNGTYVKSISTSSMHESMERFFINKDRPYLELMQIREIIEPAAAALAAERDIPEVIEELEKTIRDLDSIKTSTESYSEVNLRFHVGIIKATGNEMLLALLTPILGFLKEAVTEIQKLSMNAPTGPADHHAILECIKNKQPDAAKKLMEEHLTQAKVHLEEWLKIHKAKKAIKNKQKKL